MSSVLQQLWSREEAAWERGDIERSYVLARQGQALLMQYLEDWQMAVSGFGHKGVVRLWQSRTNPLYGPASNDAFKQHKQMLRNPHLSALLWVSLRQRLTRSLPSPATGCS